jgi:hypothetical protein
MRICVECKGNNANHWNNNFCEDCLKEMLEGEEDGKETTIHR